MKTENIKTAYLGDEVKFYEEKRKKQAYWKKEQEVVFSFLKEIYQNEGLKKITALDIPVGTGRFFDFYKKLDFNCLGLDISEEMLEVAKNKSKSLSFDVELKKGDITNIGLESNSVDVVVCIRILNMLNFDNFLKAMKEIVRVSNKYIICGIGIVPSFKNTPLLKKINILIRRLLAKILDFIRRDKTRRWSEKLVIDQFSKNSLTILNKARIDLGRGGYAYYVYLLKK